MNIKNEKRKWQIALRRYIIEKAPSVNYAKYFGLDIEYFRSWIELQFTIGLEWADFGRKWQFGHVLPLSYFNFKMEKDLLLCWNFINIKVEVSNEDGLKETKIDVLAAKSYFDNLYKKTNYRYCQQMLSKISEIEAASKFENLKTEKFLIDNKEYIENLTQLDAEELGRLNSGSSLKNILAEKEILKKFG